MICLVRFPIVIFNVLCIKSFLSILYLDCCLLPVSVIINPYCLPLLIATLVHLIFICIVSFLTIVMKLFAAVKCIASLCLFLTDPASDVAVDTQ